MTAFLQEVAKAIVARHGKELREVAVVLPSRRAGLYLRKWLAQEAHAPLWGPEVFTMGTFMERLSDLRPLPPEELLLEAYEAYREVEMGKAQPVGEFLQWASTSLADMSEADAYLVPLDRFYRDLRSWEELDWSFNDSPLSHGQERMVRFWAMMGRMHAALNTRLLAQGTGTTGLIERMAACAPFPEGAWKAVWFSGLNALTAAQESVIGRFAQRGIAQLAWDADNYYLDDLQQEAGDHLRKAIASFGPGVVPARNGLSAGQLGLRLVRAPNGVAQAWSAAELLRAASPGERAETAVVLADESLLQPLLEALPDDMGPLNVTMGLPIALLPVGSYLHAVHALHAGWRRDVGFFHADVERFLGHPFLQHGALATTIADLLGDVRSAQRTFIPSSLLKTAFAAVPDAASGDAEAAFADVTDVRTMMPVVTGHALSWAARAMTGDAFATEQIYQASLVLRRVHLLLGRYEHHLDIGAYAQLFQRLLRSARIGLFGEPLAGIQVMGMLEARALDPARVVVLGAQEGSLPSAGADRSFIPFELRRAHGLPLRDGADAVQAYNFLRLLQRAEQAVLIWPEGPDAAGPSRFILQLERELFHGRPDRIASTDVRVRMPVRTEAAVAVRKKEADLEAVRALLEKGLSPSALGDWLRCPLDFHFKRVLQLRESAEVDARIADHVTGSALHAMLESVYRPLIGKPLEAAPLLDAVEHAEDLLLAELGRADVDAAVLRSGQPLLQLRMATHAARRFLRNEARAVKAGAVITPLDLELDMGQRLSMAEDLMGGPVRIIGRLDRVDVCNGRVRILDLKAGKVEPAKLNVRELSLDALKGEKRHAAQLMTYVWLYLTQHPQVEGVEAGILPLQRATSHKPMLLKIEGETLVQRSMLPAIGQVLADAVAGMMEPQVPVMHDPKSKYCRFCLKAED
jgi:hypothetical protein